MDRRQSPRGVFFGGLDHLWRYAGVPGVQSRKATVALAIRNAVIHPVPILILAGLLFSQTGWTIPPVIDRPLELLGQALGPLAL
jgi:predicted permease